MEPALSRIIWTYAVQRFAQTLVVPASSILLAPCHVRRLVDVLRFDFLVTPRGLHAFDLRGLIICVIRHILLTLLHCLGKVEGQVMS